MLMDMVRLLFNMILRFGFMEALMLAIAVSNVFAFFLFLVDKHSAIAGKRRISERVLVFFTLFCVIGASIAMWASRHKTKKPKFKIAVAIGIIFALVPIVHIAHGLTLGRIVRFAEMPFYSANWPSALSGYRIAFMADIHMLPHENMREIVTS